MRISVFKRMKAVVKMIVEHTVGNEKYDKFVIITSPRTGSNLLVSLLSSNRYIHAEGELFNHIQEESCSEIWQRTFSKHLPWIKAVGFKIFYDHPLASEDKSVWDMIRRDRSIKIIQLVRENMLRSQLSLQIAYKTNIWGLTPTMKDTPLQRRRIEINNHNFVTKLREIDSHKKSIRETFEGHPFFELSYEELISNTHVKMNRIFNFLEAPRNKVKTNLRKQNSESLKDLIINYKEFVIDGASDEIPASVQVLL